jgi:hypothetical protein
MRGFSWQFSKEIKSLWKARCIECHFEIAKYLNCLCEINYAIVISERSFKSVRWKLLKENINLGKIEISGIRPGGGWISKRWNIYKFAIFAGELRTELGADNYTLLEEKEAERSGLSNHVHAQYNHFRGF